MDKLVTGYLKANYAAVAIEEREHDVCYASYYKIHQLCEQLSYNAKSAMNSPHVGLEEMDRVLQFGDILKKELDHIRIELARRKNLELMLPSPNTQHHLPCSSLLSPISPSPPSPIPQQNMVMPPNNNIATAMITQSPPGPTSPHPLVDNTSLAITTAGMMQTDSEYWRNRKMDPTKIVRRTPTPLYVNLTEQMILAQSSKRKRPAEGDLFCHNCKTKDTPEWRRGPMGAKTLCNACGIRWRLSQAELSKKKDYDLSPTQSPSLAFPISHIGIPSPHSPQSPPSPIQMQVSPTLLQHPQLQQQLRQQQQLQQHFQQQQQQLQQQLHHQYAQSHTLHNPQHPQQQHMVVSGPVGMAQENIPVLSNDANVNRVLQSLSLTPIAT